MSLPDIQERFELDPPDESYEIVLREVQAMIQDLTPDDAFFLVVARRIDDEDVRARVSFSGGREQISYAAIDAMAQMIMTGNNGRYFE